MQKPWDVEEMTCQFSRLVRGRICRSTIDRERWHWFVNAANTIGSGTEASIQEATEAAKKCFDELTAPVSPQPVEESASV